MKITREELQAIENHMSNIPQVAGMYTPVLVAWCRALLDEHDGAFTRGAEEMRLACQEWCRAWENNGEAIADALEDLRVEGNKP
jgi:hypothetical protein